MFFLFFWQKVEGTEELVELEQDAEVNDYLFERERKEQQKQSETDYRGNGKKETATRNGRWEDGTALTGTTVSSSEDDKFSDLDDTEYWRSRYKSLTQTLRMGQSEQVRGTSVDDDVPWSVPLGEKSPNRRSSDSSEEGRESGQRTGKPQDDEDDSDTPKGRRNSGSISRPMRQRRWSNPLGRRAIERVRTSQSTAKEERVREKDCVCW